MLKTRQDRGVLSAKREGQEGDPSISVAHASSGKEGSRMLLLRYFHFEEESRGLGIKIFRGISTAKSRGDGHLGLCLVLCLDRKEFTHYQAVG
jgi:hypothetical protein